MRVALLQIDLSGRSRAEGFQRVAAAIDAAAGADPGPDLVVLPGGTDLIGVSSRSVTAASLDAFREFLSLKAREWGVFLAAGLTRREEQNANASAVVFDPDGDVVLDSRNEKLSATTECGTEQFWDTSVGRLGVLNPEAVELCHAGQPAGSVVPLMIWPIAGAVSTRRRDRLAALRGDAAVGGGRHWAVAVPASGADAAVVSFVKTCDGETLAAAPDGGAAVVMADVPTETTEDE